MSNRRHIPGSENIYSSACIQALEQEYCSSCSAAVVSSCLVSSHGFGARMVSRIYNGGRQAVYTATVGAMLMQNMAMPAYANLTVNAGQTSTGLTVGVDPSNSVVTKLSNYGVTINTVVNSGGGEIIYSGGITSNTIVNSHGWQDASSGGTAISTTVNSGGWQEVYNSGTTSNTTVNSGGRQDVLNGGIANNTTVNNGGWQDVSSGGTTSNTTVNSGSWQEVKSGGIASHTIVNSGSFQHVNSGGSSVDVIQNIGGNINARVANNGAYISGTNQNGETILLSNGIASNFIKTAGIPRASARG